MRTLYLEFLLRGPFCKPNPRLEGKFWMLLLESFDLELLPMKLMLWFMMQQLLLILRDFKIDEMTARGLEYFIGESENELGSRIGVRIFDKSTNEWVIPIVLGTKPKPSGGHSAIVLDQDRILVIKGNTTSDVSFWFLEVLMHPRDKFSRHLVYRGNKRQ